jgi:hypothetical protein
MSDEPITNTTEDPPSAATGWTWEDIRKARADGAEVTVEVPDDQAAAVAAELAAAGHAVEIQRNGGEQIRTVADLLASRSRGALVEIAVPHDTGSLVVRLWLKVGAVVAEKVARIRADMYRRLTGTLDAMEKDAAARVEALRESPPEANEPPVAGWADALEWSGRQEEELEKIQEAAARRLYQTGFVASWDETTTGFALEEDTFVQVYRLPGFAAALFRRFDELNLPRAHRLADEGKGSPPDSDGTGGSSA